MKVTDAYAQVVGVLHSQGQQFSMISTSPMSLFTGVPNNLREHVLVFHCVVEGFVQPVFVARGDFLITPLIEPKTLNVKYAMDEEDDSENKSSYLVSDSVE